MIETGFDALLAGNEAVQAVVGQRVFLLTLPEECQMPAISYQPVAGASFSTYDTSGMQNMRLQIDCWGENAGQAAELAGVVVAQFNGFVGLLSDGTYLQDMDLVSPPFPIFEYQSAESRYVVEFTLVYTIP